MSVDLEQIARDLNLRAGSVQRTVELLDEGNTIPFVTRYRKDHTGGLDETDIRRIHDAVTRQRMLDERKGTILKSIESQGKLTDALARQIAEADLPRRLEDLYLPFKPKKETRAAIARRRGLEPLAEEIMAADPLAADLPQRALLFISEERQVRTLEEVLTGASDIIAERFSEHAELRGKLRKLLWQSGELICSGTRKVEAKRQAAQVKQQETLPQEAAPQEAAPQEAAPQEAAPQEAAPQDAKTQDVEPPAAVSEQEVAEPAPLSGTAESEQHSPEIEPAGSDGPGDAPSQAPQPDESNLPPGEPSTPADDSGETTGAAAVSGTDVEAPSAPASEEPKQPPPPQKPPRRKQQQKQKQAKTKKELKQERLEKALADYFDFRQRLTAIPPHRILAINRGERAKMLKVRIDADAEKLHAIAEEMLVPPDHPHSALLASCVREALSRMLLPGLEREIRRELTQQAEDHAIDVFARNLRSLLLGAPLRGRRLLAIDPGFKSGCKLCALDEFGQVLDHGMLHLVGSQEKKAEGRRRLAEMILQHELAVIAVGNGTAGRQVERLVAEVISNELAGRDVRYTVVNEAGASVYSTSELGREELPACDATQRSAVSIGRRLLDPLSELVKINPANLGVGLYQHDLKSRHLQNSLDAVVESCVNFVGVDVNTASPALLRYVSGLNQLTARRLFEHRQQYGPFKTREELRDVPGFGRQAYVQAAGFLKINGGGNPLDATSIHPESYTAAQQVLARLTGEVGRLPETPPAELAGLPAELGVGKLLLDDMLAALRQPGRDPREDLPPPILRKGILKLEDLETGMELTGSVLNVVDFGCFVDIGLPDSGLVHISRLSEKFVTDPHEVVSVGDVIRVWVHGVDKERRRVALSAVDPAQVKERPPRRERSPRREEQSPRPARSKKPQGKPPGKRQGKERGSRPQGTREFVARKKPQPVRPITRAMKEGREPLRSFSDLAQFLDKGTDAAKKDDAKKSEKKTESKPPADKAKDASSRDEKLNDNEQGGGQEKDSA